MTKNLGSAATVKVVHKLVGPGGVNANLGALTQSERDLAGLIEMLAYDIANITSICLQCSGDQV